MADDPETGADDAKAPTNSIRETRKRSVDPEASAAHLSAGEGPTTRPRQGRGIPDRPVPEAVRQQFTQVGNKYHFKDGAVAFTDRGNRLTSPSENTEVIKSLIKIAEARGWSDITVSGSERFRRDAWTAARLSGLKVRGYSPTEFEQARLVRILARETQPEEPAPPPAGVVAPAERRNRESPSRQRQESFYQGRLVDHGPAPYRHDPKHAPSYFVRLETPEGDREVWGVDLRRALKESLSAPQLGDEVGVRAVRRDAVKVWAPEMDADGEVIGKKHLERHRNAWIVEKAEFFAERARAAEVLRDSRIAQDKAVKRRPELVGTYLQLHAAELAAKTMRDLEDQRRFVSSIRHALADSIARGEPMATVRLKEPEQVPTAAPVPKPPLIEPAPTR